MVPDAVVLVATLRPPATSASAAAAADDAQPAERPAAPAEAQPSDGNGAADTVDRSPDEGDAARRLPDADDGVLVGTVEMAFTDQTRTRFLTLNPPTVSARPV